MADTYQRRSIPSLPFERDIQKAMLDETRSSFHLYQEAVDSIDRFLGPDSTELERGASLATAHFPHDYDILNPVDRQDAFKAASVANLKLAFMRFAQLATRLMLPLIVAVQKLTDYQAALKKAGEEKTPESEAAGEGALGATAARHGDEAGARVGDDESVTEAKAAGKPLSKRLKTMLRYAAIFVVCALVAVPLAIWHLTPLAAALVLAALLPVAAVLYVAVLCLRDVLVCLVDLAMAAYYGMRTLMAMKGFDLKVAKAVRAASRWARRSKVKMASAVTLLVVAAVGALYAAQVAALVQAMQGLQAGGALIGLSPSLTVSVAVALIGLVAAGTVYGFGRHPKIHGTRRGYGRELVAPVGTVLLVAAGLTALNVLFPAAAASLPAFSLPLAGLGLVALSVGFRVAALRTPMAMPKFSMKSGRGRDDSQEEAQLLPQPEGGARMQPPASGRTSPMPPAPPAAPPSVGGGDAADVEAADAAAAGADASSEAGR